MIAFRRQQLTKFLISLLFAGGALAKDLMLQDQTIALQSYASKGGESAVATPIAA